MHSQMDNTPRDEREGGLEDAPAPERAADVVLDGDDVSPDREDLAHIQYGRNAEDQGSGDGGLPAGDPGAVGDNFGNALRHFRRMHKPPLTQEVLARQSGVNQTYISLLESGQRTRVSRPVLASLAEALGILPEELIAASRLPNSQFPEYIGRPLDRARAEPDRGRGRAAGAEPDVAFFLGPGLRLLNRENRWQVALIVRQLLARQAADADHEAEP